MDSIINSLSEIDQKVIDLYHWQKKTVEEIASELKVKRGTITSRLHRIRERISKELKRRGLDKELR